MRRIFCWLIAVPIVLLLTVDGLAQSPSSSPPQYDSGARRQPRTSLLAHSDMQRPRPLPIVRPLRFEEIPVAADVPSVEDRRTRLGNAAEDRDDQTKETQSPGISVASDEAR